jgi:peptide/nickel transport system permease protein
MLGYILKRLLYMIPTLFGMSVISFLIIQLPPGDYLTSMIATMSESGQAVDPAQIERLKEVYGFDDPFYLQYFKWMSGIVLRGDFGWSFEWNQPVSGLIWDRMGSTLAISLLSLVFVWVVALPIGIYSAVRRHSIGDHVFTFLGFIGLAVPNFILALTLMYVAYRYLGQSVGGLNAPEFAEAPWSLAKLADFLAHLWIPIIIIGASGTAALIRILRAHRPRQGTAGIQGDPEIPGAHRAEPVRLGDRLGAAAPRLGRHHHRHRAQPADGRAAALPRPHLAGHVPRRQLHPAA